MFLQSRALGQALSCTGNTNRVFLILKGCGFVVPPKEQDQVQRVPRACGARRRGSVKVCVVDVVLARAAEQLRAGQVQRDCVPCGGATAESTLVLTLHRALSRICSMALATQVYKALFKKLAESKCVTPMPAQAPGKAAAWPLQCCRRDCAAAAQCRHTTAGVSAPCCFCTRKLRPLSCSYRGGSIHVQSV